MMPSSCLATSTCLLGYRWLYVSIVVCTFSCPSRSAISSGEKPISTSRLAWLCRMSCTRIRFTPDERAAVYTRTKRFDSGRRLYEFEDMLGVSFMRISKSVLINLQYLECVEPTLGGLMMVTLKNGCKECISRKYLPAFKKYLGL